MSVPSAIGAKPAATAAAEPPEEPPGTRARSQGLRVELVRAVLGRRAHRELVHVRLADEHGARRLEARDRGGGERRPIALEDPRAAGRRLAGDVEQVLDRDRARPRAGPGRCSTAGRRSAGARASARSASRWRNAPSAPSVAAMRSRCARATSSSAEISRARTAAAASATPIQQTSGRSSSSSRHPAGRAARGTGRRRRRARRRARRARRARRGPCPRGARRTRRRGSWARRPRVSSDWMRLRVARGPGRAGAANVRRSSRVSDSRARRATCSTVSIVTRRMATYYRASMLALSPLPRAARGSAGVVLPALRRFDRRARATSPPPRRPSRADAARPASCRSPPPADAAEARRHRASPGTNGSAWASPRRSSTRPCRCCARPSDFFRRMRPCGRRRLGRCAYARDRRLRRASWRRCSTTGSSRRWSAPRRRTSGWGPSSSARARCCRAAGDGSSS